MEDATIGSRLVTAIGAAALAASSIVGCTMMVGPDYVEPVVPVAGNWIEAGDPALDGVGPAYDRWWSVFDDPRLDALVDAAVKANPTLEIAALRVVEAQARRGIAIGNLFPQQQNATASYTRGELSRNRANQGSPGLDDTFDDWQLGFDAGWEIDIWGRLRRGVQAADAELMASLADYDDILVTLIAEVVANYVRARVLDESERVLRENAANQRRTVEIAEARFRNGFVSELDVAQARTLYHGTESRIPEVEAEQRQVQNILCLLLGIPPRDLSELVGSGEGIPNTPRALRTDVPASLLRRRPDIRAAERQAAAQSARIGVAKSDLLPRFAILGTVNLAAKDADELFRGSSLEAFGGPSVSWAVLNYGRITNNIRVQDARFQQLLTAYEDTVLRAQSEVENAIASYLGANRQLASVEKAVTAARRAVDLSTLRYREGLNDYLRVLNAQEFLLDEEERLVRTRGSRALSLVALYKAFGGGWELRTGKELVPAATQNEMRERTRWGSLLSTSAP